MKLPVQTTLPPTVPRALDTDAMAHVLAGLLPGLHVLSCQLLRVKLRLQGTSSISYRLSLLEPQCGRVFEQDVSARLCRGGGSARRFAEAAQQPWRASAAGPALSHLPELDMVLHWLPNDAKLPAVGLLLDDAELRQHCLLTVVAALTAGDSELVGHHTTLVQHVPELRVCARVELQLRDAAGQGGVHTVYAKADLEHPGAVTQRHMQTLWHSAAQRSGRLHTPRPLLWHEPSGLHWQCAAPGRPLADLGDHVSPAWSARVATSLAALHGTVLRELPALPVAHLMADAEQAAALLLQVQPAWHDEVGRAWSALMAWPQASQLLADEPVVTLHGDLHPGNLLVNGDQLSLIDLDSLRAGPAVWELGGWWADVLYRGLLVDCPLHQLAPAADRFLAAYEEAAGVHLHRRLLAWCTAWALLAKRAQRCAANLKPGRLDVVPALLALASTLAHSDDPHVAFVGWRRAA
jgi:Phosphotransferase enzyme family